MAAPGHVDVDIASFLDGHVGSDLSDLCKCKALLHDALERKKSVHTKIFQANAAAPSQIEQALYEAESVAGSLANVDNVYGTLEETLQRHSTDVVPYDGLVQLSRLLKQVKTLGKYQKYLQWIDSIESTSALIKSSLLVESVQQAVDNFVHLVAYLNSLRTSKCVHLVKYLKETVNYWHALVRRNLAAKYEKVLVEANWPRATVITKEAVTGASKEGAAAAIIKGEDHRTQLEHLIKMLLVIQLPDYLLAECRLSGKSHPVISSLPHWKPFLLPIELLVEPFRKRFKYHFSGKKQTNDLTKPEWYLTQVLHWVRDNSHYLLAVIQPIMHQSGYTHVNTRVELMRAMVQLVLEKMVCDIPELMYDDHTFAHFIDEILAFDKDLHDMYDYPPSAPSCLHALSAEEPFRKWLSIEKKFATEKIDAMLSSPTAWRSACSADISNGVLLEQAMIPECAENFIALTTTLTERYKSLPYAVCRLLFLDLQLELLDDVRLRLLQIMKHETESKSSPLTARYCAALNTLHCLSEAMAEWNQLPFFVQLQFHKEKFGAGASLKSRLSKDANYESLERAVLGDPEVLTAGRQPDKELQDAVEAGVFDGTLRLYEHLERDSLTTLVQHTAADVRAKARAYADSGRSMWTSMPSKKELAFVSLSNSACGMLLVLQEHLQTAHSLLTRRAFAGFWRQLAGDLDAFLFAKVVGENYFNEGGAVQFQFDMTRNLFPIFGKYTLKPENCFKKVKEAAILLTMLPGSAILLKDVMKKALHTLESSSETQDPIAAIQEHGIYRLTPEESELVLSRRLDIVPM